MSVQVKGRLRVQRVPIKRISSTIGLDKKELVVAGLTAVAVILVILYCFLSLRPVHARVADARARDAAQQKVITGSGSKTTDATSAKSQIKLAKASLDDFEEHWLKPMSGGRIEVINEINQLVAADKLHLAGGIEMRLAKKIPGGSAGGPDESDSKEPTHNRKSDALDVFPKTVFHFSVIGGYAEVRKFMQDLQNSKDFLVIDSIALGDVEPKVGRGLRGANAANLGAGVELTTTLTAYFRP